MALPRHQLHLTPGTVSCSPSPVFTHLNLASQQSILQLLNGCPTENVNLAYPQSYNSLIQEELRTGASCTFLWTTAAASRLANLRERLPNARYVLLFYLKADASDLRCLALASALVDLVSTCESWGAEQELLSIGFRFSRNKRVFSALVFDGGLGEAFRHVAKAAEECSPGFAFYHYPQHTMFATRWMGKQSMSIDPSFAEDVLCQVNDTLSGMASRSQKGSQEGQNSFIQTLLHDGLCHLTAFTPFTFLWMKADQLMDEPPRQAVYAVQFTAVADHTFQPVALTYLVLRFNEVYADATAEMVGITYWFTDGVLYGAFLYDDGLEWYYDCVIRGQTATTMDDDFQWHGDYPVVFWNCGGTPTPTFDPHDHLETFFVKTR
ncbi:hypothetical protein FA13DRAFT_1709941 [Coprinellus micaceus]|uniref:Uncharacterized protein n=1 Tax=Coprinellus micaceus TaxID=71717 RepID=A0A4Y7TA97_COPMI|nr:hypothetical protein FA13DRAFT_1709941 [Coprinellus micaceus]